MFITLTASFRESIANLICPEQLNERRSLTRAVNVDALTGLANRRAFELALPGAEADPDIAVIVFDANNFGKVNKTAGHAFGDVILREMADFIQTAAKASGCGQRVFKIGGDEFVVFAPIADAAKIQAAAEAWPGLMCGTDRVSVSGTIGGTFDEADKTLQGRKAGRKQKYD